MLVAVDEQDLSYVVCWEPRPNGDRRLICAARANDRVPPNASAEHVREAMQKLQQTRRHYRKYASAARQNLKRLPDLVAEAQAAQVKQAATLAPTGTFDNRPIRVLRTQFERQLKEAHAAAERAKKAGQYCVLDELRGLRDDDDDLFDDPPPRRLSAAEIMEEVRDDEWEDDDEEAKELRVDEVVAMMSES